MSGYQLPQAQIQTQSVHSKDITGNEAHVLDVRNDNEWNNGHLSQAVHVPHGKLLETDLPFNRNDVIYVHCQSGIRSSIAIGICLLYTSPSPRDRSVSRMPSSA